MIIDVHGHYTTAPKALEQWRNQQIASIKDPSVKPKVADLKISDDELRESIETNQLAKMRERGGPGGPPTRSRRSPSPSCASGSATCTAASRSPGSPAASPSGRRTPPAPSRS